MRLARSVRLSALLQNAMCIVYPEAGGCLSGVRLECAPGWAQSQSRPTTPRPAAGQRLGRAAQMPGRQPKRQPKGKVPSCACLEPAREIRSLGGLQRRSPHDGGTACLTGPSELKPLSLTMELLIKQEKHASLPPQFRKSPPRKEGLGVLQASIRPHSQHVRVQAGVGPVPRISRVAVMHAVIDWDAEDVLHLSIYLQRPPGARCCTAMTSAVSYDL